MTNTPVHATTVSLDGKGVLIRGASGSGKTSLALSLMEKGAQLVADDYTHLEASGGRVMATAPSNIKGKIEVRGFGLITTAYVDHAAIALIIDIVPHADVPRMPDEASDMLCSITTPRLFLGVHDVAASGKIHAVLKSMEEKA